jgi:hypothetical protein|tara:strand:+ start:368 stop:616 length:249 start_codon:yes stop_codon:yes gene_type:complete
MDKVSHNVVPGIDDMEYVEMFNLDPTLAYTPEINEAILLKVRSDNYAGAIADGLSEAEATASADNSYRAGQNTVAKAIADRS